MEKKSNIKKFFEFVTMADKPTVKPGVKPTTRPAPSRPSPIRRDRPGIKPRPKADYDDIINKLLANMDEADKEKIENYYKDNYEEDTEI